VLSIVEQNAEGTTRDGLPPGVFGYVREMCEGGTTIKRREARRERHTKVFGVVRSKKKRLTPERGFSRLSPAN